MTTQFAAPLQPAFKPIDRLEYLRMYNFVFENPNWVTNVLLTAVCVLIPVVGPIVILGYQYEIMLGLLSAGGARYPDFDFNRFADYLMRGLWPFLVALVAALPIGLVMSAIVVPGVLLIFAGATHSEMRLLVLVIGVPLFVLVVLTITIAIQLLMLPLQMRAGLTQDFGAAFNFAWILDFVKKTWLEMFLGLVFLMFSYVVLALLGMLVFCVGMYAAAALFTMAHGYLLYQLYLLYLSRGGEPVAIKLSSR